VCEHHTRRPNKKKQAKAIPHQNIIKLIKVIGFMQFPLKESLQNINITNFVVFSPQSVAKSPSILTNLRQYPIKYF
jgi:hypothetical protein